MLESLEKKTLKLKVDVLYYDTPRPVCPLFSCVFPREKVGTKPAEKTDRGDSGQVDDF